jgi:hypothetical protein
MTLDLATTVVGVLVLLSISVLVGTAMETGPRRSRGPGDERRRLAEERQALAVERRRLAIERAILTAAAKARPGGLRHGCPRCGCPNPPSTF